MRRSLPEGTRLPALVVDCCCNIAIALFDTEKKRIEGASFRYRLSIKGEVKYIILPLPDAHLLRVWAPALTMVGGLRYSHAILNQQRYGFIVSVCCGRPPDPHLP